jgi:serpin B
MKLIASFCSGLILAAILFVPGLVFADSGPPDIGKVVGGNTEFAMDLYARLRSAPGNVFFSPYSISTALAMTYAGANGETANQMTHTLHLDLPPDKLHPAFAELETDLNAIQEKQQVQLAAANSLWPQIGFDFRPDYLALCKQYYGAAIFPVDFVQQTEAARTKINDWVSVRTNRKIPELIKPGILNASDRLVLVDAIYFKGNWQSKFDAAQTEDQPFHISSKISVTAPLMQQTSQFGYVEFPGLQVLEMPYTGGDISMIVLLPQNVDGLDDLEKRLTTKNLERWTQLPQLFRPGLPHRTVHVFFPKFLVRSQFSLADTLSAMGMPDAFDSLKADFSGMDGRRDLYISRVIHEAYANVDEKGTEAAAATAVTATYGAAPENPPPIPVFRADHPFLFLIRDNVTGSILFLGRVMNPN